MTHLARTRLLISALVAPAMVLAVSATASAAPPSPPPALSAQQLTPSETIDGTKSATSRLAESDPALLKRTDSKPVSVMVKLDYDSAATYTGGVDDLPATSPSVTGKPLSGRTAAERKYATYAAGQEASFRSALAKAAPGAKVGASFRTVYGGMRVTVPANKVADVLKIANVVAVQSDKVNQPLTDASPSFIGATSMYPKLGGTKNAGKGVVFGVLDSGVWPEHPSFADQGNLSAPPAKADGTARTCNFGDNPLTPASDPFVCNNKLIGGQPFLDGYLSNPANPPEPYTTARDSNGHGTHTASTSAGNSLRSASVFGVERGPLNGIAPGAWVSVYKVCGIDGCVASDSAAAVQQAVLDGVDVINFSISGGTDPFSDPVELAFLDAYAAGVFVAASAGNDGPDAGTANHLSAWTTTVGASTQTREFRSHLTVTAGSGSFEADGASVMNGTGATPLPIVLASAAPYSDALCTKPAAPGTFTGKIVACQRGTNARVEKGYNVLQGGAAGMVLYNLPPTTDVETDNHWLPAVHLVDGTDLVAFLTSNPGAVASFTAGAKARGQGDVMASFSSRGPAGAFIKPDITAPGVQILAGASPTPDEIAVGPAGQYFQAIAGTSMSSPHIAGSAVLVKALHPDWTPMEIRSALMMTATTKVTKEDGSTAADAFDMGAGRVDLTKAGNPGLVLDESAENMVALAAGSSSGVHLNQPSVNAPVMPGRLVTERTFTNVTGKTQTYKVKATAPTGTSIKVSPTRFSIRPGAQRTVKITLSGPASGQQKFGKITLTPTSSGKHAATAKLHLPVAFIPQQGDVTLASSCDPSQIAVRGTTQCEITATNTSFHDTKVDLRTSVNQRLAITSATGATLRHGVATATLSLPGNKLGVPSVGPGALFGYIPLDSVGVTPTPVTDEQILNFNVPAFVYNGVTYSRVGVTSNGYLVAGGGDSSDINCCNLPSGASPAKPNNVLAPFWTDLDGAGAPGVFAATLTDGVDEWLVVEWRVNVWGTNDTRTFQTWIGTGAAQDITFAYDPAKLPTDPNGQPFLVGAENASGEGQVSATLPAADLRVTSTDPVNSAGVSYKLTVKGVKRGAGVVTTELVGPDLPGATTIVRSDVQVR